MQQIIIKNFGPVRNIDIDLDKELEVIIGPQASGKSTFSKTVYFCKKIRDYFMQYLDGIMGVEYRYNNELYVKFLKFLRRPFMGYFGTTKHMVPFMIKYYYEKEHGRYVTIGLDDDHYAKFEFSDEMREAICDMIKQVVLVSNKSKDASFAQSFLNQRSMLEKMKAPVNAIFGDDDMLVYIPAGRNLLAIIPDAFGKKTGYVQNDADIELEIDISQIDLITQEFIQYIRDMRADFGSKLEEMTQNYLKTVKGQIKNHDVEMACRLIRQILRADYVCDKDGEKLFYDDEHWVKLMFGSSGQQEIVWGLNIIFLAILKNEKTFLVFEEPESHLFPDSQAVIAELVALMIHSSGSRGIITTHSPYMLTAVNLLLYSGKEEENRNKDTVVRKELRLQPGSTGAYFLSNETGCLKNIMGTGKGLIDALEIDGISGKINEQMDRILENSVRHRGIQ